MLLRKGGSGPVAIPYRSGRSRFHEELFLLLAQSREGFRCGECASDE
jgi:hypothetical protein